MIKIDIPKLIATGLTIYAICVEEISVLLGVIILLTLSTVEIVIRNKV